MKDQHLTMARQHLTMADQYRAQAREYIAMSDQHLTMTYQYITLAQQQDQERKVPPFEAFSYNYLTSQVLEDKLKTLDANIEAAKRQLADRMKEELSYQVQL